MTTVHGTARRQQKFARELKRGEAERVRTSTKTFETQILLQYTENQLAKAQKKLQEGKPVRRDSIRAPETEDFYYDELDTSKAPESLNHHTLTYDFDKDVTIEATHSPVTDITHTQHHTTNPEPKPVENHNEQDLFKHVYRELDDMKQQRDALELKLTSALSNITHLETSVTQLKHETNSANKALMQERTRIEIAQRAKQASPPRTNIVATARNIASDIAETRANAFRLEAEKRASKAEQKASRLAKQRDVAQAALAAEKHRVTKWEEARRKHVSKPAAMGKLNNLEGLLQQMDAQRSLLDHADYSPLWREDVLKNIDLCLSVLYSCENDIVDKRNTFVERSCAVESSTKEFIARRSSVPAVSR